MIKGNTSEIITNIVKYGIAEDLSGLNDDQKEAYIKLISAVQHKDGNRQILLNAPGGCGKTYILNRLLESLIKNNDQIKIAVLAPTHKAKKVIKNSFKIKTKQMYFATIASFLGYTEKVDENGETQISYHFDTKKKSDLIIVDECSMISKVQSDLLNEINSIIIYSGDECQLNPVGEDLSAIFSKNFDIKLSLTKNERANSKNVVEMINSYRKNVYENRMSKISLNNEFIIDSKLMFKKHIYEAFENNRNAIVLAWTNSKVSEYNNDIRERLFLEEGEELDKYYEGECVMFSKYAVLDGIRFYTSDKVILKSVVKKDFYVRMPTCICNKLYSFGKLEKIIKESENSSDETSDSDAEDEGIQNKKKNFYKYEEEKLVLEDPLEKDTGVKKCTKCFTQASKVKYKKIKLWRLEIIDGVYAYKYDTDLDRSAVFNLLYKYKDRAKCLKIKDLWVEYYNDFETLNAPIDYTYSSTVHKAQGSGYENVFVDLSNMLLCKDEKQKTRLAYTAVSRTSDKILIYKGV